MKRVIITEVKKGYFPELANLYLTEGQGVARAEKNVLLLMAIPPILIILPLFE